MRSEIGKHLNCAMRSCDNDSPRSASRAKKISSMKTDNPRALDSEITGSRSVKLQRARPIAPQGIKSRFPISRRHQLFGGGPCHRGPLLIVFVKERHCRTSAPSRSTTNTPTFIRSRSLRSDLPPARRRRARISGRMWPPRRRSCASTGSSWSFARGDRAARR